MAAAAVPPNCSRMSSRLSPPREPSMPCARSDPSSDSLAASAECVGRCSNCGRACTCRIAARTAALARLVGLSGADTAVLSSPTGEGADARLASGEATAPAEAGGEGAAAACVARRGAERCRRVGGCPPGLPAAAVLLAPSAAMRPPAPPLSAPPRRREAEARFSPGGTGLPCAIATAAAAPPGGTGRLGAARISSTGRWPNLIRLRHLSLSCIPER
mmetsp:Transcript_2919/g.8883  ORF Transcript_2919/g.8883 Transcript_2919/m.8883 type:complete len:217 (-) Transcript_2919:339-989(-)